MAGGCPGHASLCHFTSQAGEGKPIQHPGELWAEMDEGLCPSSCSLTLKCSLMRQLESDPLMGQIKDYLAKHLGINWYQSKDSPAESPGAEATVCDCCPWTSAAPMVAPGLGTSAQGGLRGPCDPHGGIPQCHCTHRPLSAISAGIIDAANGHLDICTQQCLEEAGLVLATRAPAPHPCVPDKPANSTSTRSLPKTITSC